MFGEILRFQFDIRRCIAACLFQKFQRRYSKQVLNSDEIGTGKSSGVR